MHSLLMDCESLVQGPGTINACKSPLDVEILFHITDMILGTSW